MIDDPPLFDPDGVFWRVNRESVLLVGGGAALLLQVAHPLIAAGVHEHSGFRDQPIRRLYGTVTAMQQMIYGPRSVALGAARRVNAVHRRVHGRVTTGSAAFPAGTPYDARDPALLLWVHSTLVATALTTYETFLPPLSEPERERYYQESKTIGSLLGLSPEHLPRDWERFCVYWHGMLESDVLAVNAVTRELAEHILYPPVSWVPHIAGDVLSVATAALLPERVRRLYGLRWGERRVGAWRFGRRVIRRLLPYVPELARTGPRVWRLERRLRNAG